MLLPLLAIFAAISTVCASEDFNDADFQNQVLETHNKIRKEHKVEPLVWDDELAKHAKRWANTCVWHHSNDTRPYGDKCGENISYGQPSISAAIAEWHDLEVNDYNFGTGESKNGNEIRHFTQVVWRKTQKVGCAQHYCDNDPDTNKDLDGNFYVCNYYPQGNIRTAEAYTHNVYSSSYEQ
ncbi:CAP domain-containing protein [Parasitella parasitica]|nr:CAP domain-containing protein [Parasitella parasitica]